MIINPNPTAAELAVLARMHAISLPTSVITQFGPNYMQDFYQFVATSPSESVFVARLHGEVVGGALLSTAPATLSQRVLIGTRLAWRLFLSPRLALASAWEMLSERYSAHNAQGKPNAELFGIFVDEPFRSQGIGRKLLAAVETELQRRGFHDYFVRITDEVGNRASAFYLRAGFDEIGSVRIHGKRFRLLRKNLDCARVLQVEREVQKSGKTRT